MIIKEFRELRRDRRTMAMLIALPVLLLVVFALGMTRPKRSRSSTRSRLEARL
jgi:hypothetical protein